MKNMKVSMKLIVSFLIDVLISRFLADKKRRTRVIISYVLRYTIVLLVVIVAHFLIFK